MIYILFLALFFITNDAQAHQVKWFVLVAISAVLFCLKVSEKYTRLLGFALFYFLVNAGLHAIIRYGKYDLMSPWDRMAMHSFSANAYMLMMAVVAMIYAIKPEDLVEKGKNIAAMFCLCAAGYTIFAAITDKDMCRINETCAGILKNPSISSSLMICCFPFLMDIARGWWRVSVFILVIVATILSWSSVAYGLLVLYFVCELFWALSFKKFLIYGTLMLSVLLIISHLLLGNQMLSSRGRFEMQQKFMTVWAETQSIGYRACAPNGVLNTLTTKTHLLFGTGAGTFSNFSANIQTEEAAMNNDCKIPERLASWWLWMHNDWLQVLFELGLIGLGLIVAVYYQALKFTHAQYAKDVFNSLVLYGACALFNFPVHLSVGALLGAWLAAVALMKYTRQGELWNYLMNKSDRTQQ